MTEYMMVPKALIDELEEYLLGAGPRDCYEEQWTIVESAKPVSKPRKGSGWTDGVEWSERDHEFTVGYSLENGEQVIYERRRGFRTEHNAITAMDASYRRMEKDIFNK